MSAWAIALVVVAGALLIGGTLYSAAADRIRRRDSRSAETVDQLPVTTVNPMALPMHDRAFDKPR